MSPAAALSEAAAVSSRSLATRAKLVAIAEQLFAERGVAAVSLNEISRAAEQRHSNVCQYHFGDRDGLIQAVIDKHVPGIVARRNAMFDRMAADGRDGLADVVAAFVRPVAAKMGDPDGGVAFIRFSAQMIAANVQVLAGEGPYRFAIPEVDVLSRRLQRALAGRGLPDAQGRARWTMAAIMLFQGLAVQSQVGRDDELDGFVADLERMITGALAAPGDSEGAP